MAQETPESPITQEEVTDLRAFRDRLGYGFYRRDCVFLGEISDTTLLPKPKAGQHYLFFLPDKTLNRMDSDGSVTELAPAAGASGGVGVVDKVIKDAGVGLTTAYADYGTNLALPSHTYGATSKVRLELSFELYADLNADISQTNGLIDIEIQRNGVACGGFAGDQMQGYIHYPAGDRPFRTQVTMVIADDGADSGGGVIVYRAQFKLDAADAVAVTVQRATLSVVEYKQ